MSKPLIEMRSSAIHGNGVFAIADIAEGQEYGNDKEAHKTA